MMNIPPQPMRHLIKKPPNLIPHSLGHKLHPPIGQILHKSRHIKPPRCPLNGKPKTNPLHMPGIDHTLTYHAASL